MFYISLIWTLLVISWVGINNFIWKLNKFTVNLRRNLFRFWNCMSKMGSPMALSYIYFLTLTLFCVLMKGKEMLPVRSLKRRIPDNVSKKC